MACTFSINFSGTADALVANIQQKVLANNGQFNGDASVGNFSIQVLGTSIGGGYAVNGSEININIDKKPFFLSCDAIRDYITQNLTRQQ
ncbi:MAG: hypothetical protein QM726_19760 [Chitinophagaceae bacterium]